MNEALVRKVENISLKESVRKEIIRLITEGILKPGDRLNEVFLAEQMGVSRGPVREAARELQGQGLVISRPQQGFYVADFTSESIIDLYEIGIWIEQAIIHDILSYSDRKLCLAMLNDVENIQTDSKEIFAESLFAFRQRIIKIIHNSYLADQALFLYRQYYLVTALISVDDSQDRINRIMTMLRQFWTAMTNADRKTAEYIVQTNCAFWREDVSRHFTKDNHSKT